MSNIYGIKKQCVALIHFKAIPSNHNLNCFSLSSAILATTRWLTPSHLRIMAFDLEQFLPPHTRKALQHACPKGRLDRVPGKEYLFLDKNENAWGTVGTVENLERFPDSDAVLLRRELAELFQQPVEDIVVDKGTYALIDLIMRCFCIPHRDEIVVIQPAESIYAQMAAFHGIDMLSIDLEDVSIEKIQDKISAHTRILFFSNPNPMTGELISSVAFVDLLEDFEGLVVLDESYIDYDEVHSLLGNRDPYPNLIILRSMSHAWGMAAQPTSAAFAPPEIAEVLHCLQLPFHLDQSTQNFAVHALRIPVQRERRIQKMQVQRDALQKRLAKLKYVDRVRSSHANFLYIESKYAERIADQLEESAIFVARTYRLAQCPDSLRITVGSEEQNEQLMERLEELNPRSAGTGIFGRISRGLQRVAAVVGIFKKLF